MKYSIATLSLLALACEAFAFVPSAIKVNNNLINVKTNTSIRPPSNRNNIIRIQSSNIEEDCGCASSPIETIYSGKPSDFARNNINHRSVIGNIPLYKIDGSITTVDEIIGDNNDDNDKKTSLVVFMRSLG